MTGKITVKRHDYPERIRHLRNGSTKVIPAYYECIYYWNDKEIAYYVSREDVVYLKTDYLGRGKDLRYFGRMKASNDPGMWADLVQFLKINSDTKLSEYFNI